MILEILIIGGTLAVFAARTIWAEDYEKKTGKPADLGLRQEDFDKNRRR